MAKEKSKNDAKELINQIIFITHISKSYKFHIQVHTYEVKEALLHKPISKGLFHNIIFK
ncbi:hypothetical protein J945_4227 [Acinetobacter baumannii 25878_2]|nr:hypothetical protein J945_4227 [Acinetobacter baumannii 25878_2]KCY95281.1 hypothetical protein J968_4596 [Acinetobacter baumannii 26016_2]